MFRPINPNPNGKRTEDCTVRAISLATGYDWERVYIELCVQGYLMGEMPSSKGVIDAYLRGRAFERNVAPNTCPICYTVKDFCLDNPYGIFLVTTGTHILAVIDGNYYDTWDSGEEEPIYFYMRR